MITFGSVYIVFGIRVVGLEMKEVQASFPSNTDHIHKLSRKLGQKPAKMFYYLLSS